MVSYNNGVIKEEEATMHKPYHQLSSLLPSLKERFFLALGLNLRSERLYTLVKGEKELIY